MFNWFSNKKLKGNTSKFHVIKITDELVCTKLFDAVIQNSIHNSIIRRDYRFKAML